MTGSGKPGRAPTVLDAAAQEQDLRRRITYLMLFRVVVITIVLALTVLLHLALSDDPVTSNALALFIVVAVTYGLTIVYALWLPRTSDRLRLADVQIVGDLLVTTALVHLTGGAQSAYVFFYPLSIIGATMIRYRRGTAWCTVASVFLFAAVAVGGWLEWIPTPDGQQLSPSELTLISLVRHVLLQSSAILAVGVLAATLGQQVVSAGARLQSERAVSADLSMLNENIIRSLSSGLVTLDDTGHVIAFNQAAQEILGVARRDAMGLDLASLVPEMADMLASLSLSASLKRGEIATSRGTDGLSLGVSIVPLQDHRKRVVGRIVNFQDLTQLRHLEEQMLRAQRLAVVGQLAAGVAHEIRNPLASISGSIELLRGGPDLDDDSGALMDIVVREVDRLNTLITELLDYARPRESLRTSFALGEVIEETIRVFANDRRVPEVRVKFHSSQEENADAGPQLVFADPAQVRQVVWNLLRNASEAMAQGGEIHVELHDVVADGESWAELVVSDQGVGIAEDQLERVFDPFFTTKSEGTGLGLATVHRIVTEHGGTITVSSELGLCTVFTVRLPMARIDPGAADRDNTGPFQRLSAPFPGNA